MESRLVIAIDYGVTHTGVAFAISDTVIANLDEISIVNDWGSLMGNHDKIPSVISYSPASHDMEHQWGASLSPDAVAMVDTKLELDVQDNKSDELNLILKLLDGIGDLDFGYIATYRHSSYPWKAPEDVVTDYLHQVFQYLEESMVYMNSECRDRLPIDIAITIPAQWSYRGKNSILRAVRNAGFNNKTFPNLRDVVMVTEQDAAAIYAARYLKELDGREVFKQGECFVLCDAVDWIVVRAQRPTIRRLYFLKFYLHKNMASYKVTQLEPSLELELLTLPTGDRRGPAYIHRNFKRWLHRLLGDENYRRLDPGGASQSINTEGSQMREILKDFDRFKKKFTKNLPKMILDLPVPLHNLNIDNRVAEGEITITIEEMRSFLDPYVDRIVKLIQDQIQQVEQKKKIRVKKILLLSNFSESQYIKDEIEFSMLLRDIQSRWVDSPWTAVVRGAAMYAIEKSNHKNLTIVETYPRSYGVMFNQVYSEFYHSRKDHWRDLVTNRVMETGQLTWLVQKGDLLLSDTRKEVELEFTFNFRGTDDRIIKLPIYEYPDDCVPNQFGTAQEEPNEVSVLNCDFSKFPINEFDRFENSSNGCPYYKAHCICKLILSGYIFAVKIIWKEVQVCSTMIDTHTTTKSKSQNILVVLSPGTVSTGNVVMAQPRIIPSSASGEEASPDIQMADKQERNRHDQPKQDNKMTRLKTVSPDTLYGLRELIRTRYALDTEIWILRMVGIRDRHIVERKMELADEVLLKIITIVHAWEGTERLWTEHEWGQALEIKTRLRAAGKRWWVGNPPWEGD